MKPVWDDAHREVLAERASMWMDTGAIVLPVIPVELPAERWPQKNRRTGEPLVDKAGNPVARFRGKAPSYWDAKGTPRLLQRKSIADGTSAPPTREEVLQQLRQPIEVGAAKEFGSPVGFAVMTTSELVVIDLDEPEQNDRLRTLVGDKALVEASPSGGLHVVVRPADGMESWAKPEGGHYKAWSFAAEEPSVGEVLAEGSICLMAPTMRGDGASYRILQGTMPGEVETLGAMGIVASADKKTEGPPAESPTEGVSKKFCSLPESTVPALRSLLGKKARELLDGDLGAYSNDGEIERSGTLAAFAKEAYGCENTLKAEFKPFTGTADEVIKLAVDCLRSLDEAGLEPIADKAERILATINRSTCDADREALLKRHKWESEGPRVGGHSDKRSSVIKQQQEWLRVEAPFTVCGYDQTHMFILPKVSGLVQAVKLDQLHLETQLVLLTEGSKDWFYSPFAYQTKKGIAIDWKRAGQLIAASRRDIPIYDPHLIRGRGCWMDGDQAVMHLGDQLVIGGQRVPLASIPSKAIYAKAETLPGPAEAPLSDEEAEFIVGVLRHFNFEEPASSFHLLGWIVSALICGCLPWRPNIWVTAASGDGKTTLLERFVEPQLAGTAIKAHASATEAGLRQELGHDALPVLFDEIEGESRSAQTRIAAVLQLMRGASSPGGAQIIKGSSDGTAKRYVIRSSFLLSSINVSLVAEADLNRTAVVSLKPLKASQRDDWETVDADLAKIDLKTGQKLLARVLDQLPTILANCETFKRAAAKYRGSARRGDVYGTLAACALAFFPEGKQTHTVQEAMQILQRLAPLSADDTPPTEGGPDEVNRDADAEACLNHLLAQTFRVEKTHASSDPLRSDRIVMVEASLLTLMEATEGIHDGFDKGDIEIALRDKGMKLTKVADQEGLVLAISARHPGVSKLFSDTPWASKGWARALRRHELCQARQIRFGQGRSTPAEKGVPTFSVADLVADGGTTATASAHKGGGEMITMLDSADFEEHTDTAAETGNSQPNNNYSKIYTKEEIREIYAKIRERENARYNSHVHDKVLLEVVGEKQGDRSYADLENEMTIASVCWD
jgi:hypothetical protein